MRKYATIVAVLGLILVGASPAIAEELAPDWTLVSAESKSIRLSEEVQDQPVILFFWATWCPYCKALMPHLQSIRLEYGDKVKILAINFRDDGDPVAFVKNAGYNFTVLPDGDEVAAAYGVHGTPGVIVVDGDRHIRFDLRALPRKEPPASGKPASHKKKAAYRAPYWAAEIRKSIDSILAGSSQ